MFQVSENSQCCVFYTDSVLGVSRLLLFIVTVPSRVSILVFCKYRSYTIGLTSLFNIMIVTSALNEGSGEARGLMTRSEWNSQSSFIPSCSIYSPVFSSGEKLLSKASRPDTAVPWLSTPNYFTLHIPTWGAEAYTSHIRNRNKHAQGCGAGVNRAVVYRLKEIDPWYGNQDVWQFISEAIAVCVCVSLRKW